jgi:hypothetical protein
MFVCHRCDNPPCCNPDHLFVDTAGGNAADRDEKGRHRSGGHLTAGEANGNTTLKEIEVREILVMINEGIPYQEIADAFGVGLSSIKNIACGISWKHVPREEVSS